MCSDNQHWKNNPIKAQQEWLGFASGHPVGPFWVLISNTCKINLSHDMDFHGKSYGKWDKIEKPTFVWVTDERSKVEDGKPVPENNNIHNDYDEVSDYSDNKVEEKEKGEENFLSKKSKIVGY